MTQDRHSPPSTSHRELSLRDFSYSLDEKLIAQVPAPSRDSAKLLVWEREQIRHSHVRDLHDIVPKGSLFILNNSRVIPSRVRFHLPTGGVAEFLLLEPVAQQSDTEFWHALARPVRKLRAGMSFELDAGLKAEIASLPASGVAGPEPITVGFSKSGQELISWLDRHGEMPLPPYIDRKRAGVPEKNRDKERYQTVYSELNGSVAAPTAGLHFTDALMSQLKARDCQFAEVTLHVGAGTFLPVKHDDINRHRMHSERFMIPSSTLEAIALAKKEGRPVICVGTTSLRSLEGIKEIAKISSKTMESLADQWLRTEIFIRPRHLNDRFQPWAPNAIMTNFHQSESTLFMLICALCGYDNTYKIYNEAIAKEYRFFSYGDSSLLWF